MAGSPSPFWDRSARSATTSESDATARRPTRGASCLWNDTPPGERWLDSAWPEIESPAIPTSTDTPIGDVSSP